MLDEEKVMPSVGKSTVLCSLPTLGSQMETVATFVALAQLENVFT